MNDDADRRLVAESGARPKGRSGLQRFAVARLALALCCAALGSAASADSLSDAEDAYSRRDYATAQRLFAETASVAPDEETASLARYREAQCALELGQFDGALDGFRRLASSGDAVIAERSRAMVGLTGYRRGDYADARSVWLDLARVSDDAVLASQAQYAAGWCAVRLGDTSRAMEDFRRVPLLFPNSEAASRSGEMLRRLEASPSLELRSERKATLLSTFVPGAGQVYAGRVGNGCVSFVLNGLVGFALARSVTQGRWLDATFVFALGSRFYFGGRQNAGRFAAEWNANERAGFVERLSDLEP